jgi:hypothetical protein
MPDKQAQGRTGLGPPEAGAAALTVCAAAATCPSSSSHVLCRPSDAAELARYHSGTRAAAPASPAGAATDP